MQAWVVNIADIYLVKLGTGSEILYFEPLFIYSCR